MDLDKLEKRLWVGMALYIMIALGLLVFAIWVIVKLLAHFGVL